MNCYLPLMAQSISLLDNVVQKQAHSKTFKYGNFFWERKDTMTITIGLKITCFSVIIYSSINQGYMGLSLCFSGQFKLSLDIFSASCDAFLSTQQRDLYVNLILHCVFKTLRVLFCNAAFGLIWRILESIIGNTNVIVYKCHCTQMSLIIAQQLSIYSGHFASFDLL